MFTTVSRMQLTRFTDLGLRTMMLLATGDTTNRRVTIRNIRHEALKHLKENKGKMGVGEDAEKKAEEDVNDLTKTYEGQLESHFERKSKEIMTV